MSGPFQIENNGSNNEGQGQSRDRDSLFIKAEMRMPDRNAQFEARIRNISPGGLMAETPIEAERGEAVEVQLRNVGWVFGTVAWAAGTRFGVAFNAPIDHKLTRKPVGNNNDSISLIHSSDRQMFKKGRGY